MLFDPLYIIIFVVGIVLSGGASLMVKKAFAQGQKVMIRTRLTGMEVAHRILDAEGIDDVQVVEHQGFLSDHYNPMSKTLALSPDVYHGSNASAVGVAAHEVGHAIQHARSYAPLGLRSLLVPAAQFGSSLGPWLVIIGMFLGSAPGNVHIVSVIGVGLFAAASLFSLVTVPVEFDASRRAKACLSTLGVTQTGEEDAAVSKVLTAAGLTYVAAAVVALMNLVYWAFRAGLLGGRDD